MPSTTCWQRSRLSSSLSAIIVLALVGLALSACQASQDRIATETVQVGPRPTPTMTPSGEILKIDGEPVLRVYIPSLEGPPLYALTAARLFRKVGNDWQPTGTRTDSRAILVDPARPEVLYRGDHPTCAVERSEPITFSKSIDGGNSWRAVPGGDNIRPLTVDPTLRDVLYGSDCGLAISTDGGETWRDYYRATGHIVVDAVVLGEQLLVLERSISGRGRLRKINVTVPEDPELARGLIETGRALDLDAGRDRIVIGGLEGVTISTDGGDSWTASRNGLEDVTVASADTLPPDDSEIRSPQFGVLVVRLDPLHPQRIFAGTVRGLFISQDAGITWDVYTTVSRDARVIDVQFAAGGNDIYVTTPNGVLVVPNP